MNGCHCGCMPCCCGGHGHGRSRRRVGNFPCPQPEPVQQLPPAPVYTPAAGPAPPPMAPIQPIVTPPPPPISKPKTCFRWVKPTHIREARALVTGNWGGLTPQEQSKMQFEGWGRGIPIPLPGCSTAIERTPDGAVVSKYTGELLVSSQPIGMGGLGDKPSRTQQRIEFRRAMKTPVGIVLTLAAAYWAYLYVWPAVQRKLR